MSEPDRIPYGDRNAEMMEALEKQGGSFEERREAYEALLESPSYLGYKQAMSSVLKRCKQIKDTKGGADISLWYREMGLDGDAIAAVLADAMAECLAGVDDDIRDDLAFMIVKSGLNQEQMSVLHLIFAGAFTMGLNSELPTAIDFAVANRKRRETD